MRPAAGLPLRRGDHGDAVSDLQRRLARAGFHHGGSRHGEFDDRTEHAVRAFQSSCGLEVDGVCGAETWAALDEAQFLLGDRLLYLQSPMLRGDDIGELQQRLGALGFDAGRVDGIFGPATAAAVEDFQRNAGLTADGICGPETIGVLTRVDRRTGSAAVASVRERELLRTAPRELLGRRLVVGETGDLDAIATSVGRALARHGAVVEVVHHPDGSHHATLSNAFDAELYLGLRLTTDPAWTIAYFASTTGFESAGGRRFAELLRDRTRAALPEVRIEVSTRRVPVLRETRMPAVTCTFGPPGYITERGATIATIIDDAVSAWITQRLD